LPLSKSSLFQLVSPATFQGKFDGSEVPYREPRADSASSNVTSIRNLISYALHVSCNLSQAILHHRPRASCLLQAGSFLHNNVIIRMPSFTRPRLSSGSRPSSCGPKGMYPTLALLVLSTQSDSSSTVPYSTANTELRSAQGACFGRQHLAARCSAKCKPSRP
jgi:hypothetical protein